MHYCFESMCSLFVLPLKKTATSLQNLTTCLSQGSPAASLSHLLAKKNRGGPWTGWKPSAQSATTYHWFVPDEAGFKQGYKYVQLFGQIQGFQMSNGSNVK